MPTGEELERERRAKRDELSRRGGLVYPHSYPGRVPTATVRDDLKGSSPGASHPDRPFRVAGRALTIRHLGRTAFVPLRDQAGELQLFLSVDHMGEQGLREALRWLDPGDLVGAEGIPVVTRRGEPSLAVRELTLLAKALRPPPEKWHGLKDPEVRLRQRYVDLLSSPETLTRFQGRSVILRALRQHLDQEGFFGVETPVLERVASGALARPFVTHYHYLDEDYQLRIALELRLKRLIVGGFEKVYEIGPVFRNEDLDSTHVPEFSMMELYWAYADYHDLRALVERLLCGLARSAAPFLAPERAERIQRSFTPPFARIDFVQALEQHSGLSGVLELPVETLREKARAVGAAVTPASPPGYCLDKLFAHHVEPTLQEPTFVEDHPRSTTPLAKRHRSLPDRVERFELFYRGYELGNAYTELNDPDEQLSRFEEQRAARGEETYALDEDFVEALRYGMPPTTGIGMGVERLLMSLLDVPSIKDVVLFPPTRRGDSPPGPPPPSGPPG
jgi:lysyl-tRNA synthetase class 2